RSSRGVPSEPLLTSLLGDPFFAQPPPRSTGREHFGRGYAESMRARGRELGLSDADLLATAVELTARSAAEAIGRYLAPHGVDAVYASGGGTHNPTLMAALARRLEPWPLGTAAELGVAPDAKEALAFAFLAHQT